MHHGGGVGIGLAIHAGMVCVADGTDMADQRDGWQFWVDRGGTFTDVYAERPWHLREQEEQALRDRGRKRGAPNE